MGRKRWAVASAIRRDAAPAPFSSTSRSGRSGSRVRRSACGRNPPDQPQAAGLVREEEDGRDDSMRPRGATLMTRKRRHRLWSCTISAVSARTSMRGRMATAQRLPLLLHPQYRPPAGYGQPLERPAFSAAIFGWYIRCGRLNARRRDIGLHRNGGRHCDPSVDHRCSTHNRRTQSGLRNSPSVRP